MPARFTNRLIRLKTYAVSNYNPVICLMYFAKEVRFKALLCDGDETHKSWKPLLNTIYVPRGSSECSAQRM